MGLKKQIIQFKDGEKVAIYESVTEAAKILNISKNKIYKHLMTKILVALKCYWRSK